METAPRNTQQPVPGHVRPRSVALSVVLWAFGLATSLFLIGIWGRTVAVDSATIETAARTMIDSDRATDRINTWFEEGLASAASLDSATASSVVEAIEGRPQYRQAVDSIVDVFIESLFAPPGVTTQVDLDSVLSPIVPLVDGELRRRGIPVEAVAIEHAMGDAGIVVLDAGEVASVAAGVADARVFLTQVVAVAFLAMLGVGFVAVSLAEERPAMVRHLASRTVLAALSYAVILRLAGWALDPGRGRSPIAGGAGVIFASNTQVFLILAAVAGAVTASAYWIAVRTASPTVDASDVGQDEEASGLVSV